MSEAKMNPFVSEDATVQKVMEQVDARILAGEYTVAVTIKSDKYKQIWQVGQYNVAVTVK